MGHLIVGAMVKTRGRRKSGSRPLKVKIAFVVIAGDLEKPPLVSADVSPARAVVLAIDVDRMVDPKRCRDTDVSAIDEPHLRT